ncbi:phosphonoacetaldehyde hydrolase [Xanthobacter tagetidis]|uniref:Phosphonoacetaldehyde hydrolase n=1 Tax=Xanthobacter tagetidis TaxID=60216 RepID=A0A3L7AP81_9HYPH|nr:phosphonoacetaldehyde hydrolase [Xanthobacter tagetidis]MBB6307674.1 phosphonoacetaldehyde hydrolase [Xanthobacter tagetidis]RLP81232.1 phosphonoacetaldehyde hydrolase [Xanthobacter tagetidis]
MTYENISAVVFDWAGTMIDHGSKAPMGVFQRAFAQFGIDLSVAEARGPMGMAKRDHIAALMALPRVAAAWTEKHGAAPGEADIDKVYEVFVPMNVAVAADYAGLIEGVAGVVARLKAAGLKIGSTTGYTREIMAPILPLAAAQGYAPDSMVCAGDLSAGRPTPLMLYKTLIDLGVWPASRVVKVDDTEVGIAEGLNAGCWTVGIALTGNLFGLDPAETEALSPEEFEARRDAAYAALVRSGAHFVIDSVADLEEVLDEIEGALARGEQP